RGQFDQAISYFNTKVPAERRDDGNLLMRVASAHVGKQEVPQALELYLKVLSTPPVEIDYFRHVVSRDLLSKMSPEQLKGLNEQLSGRTDRSGRLMHAVVLTRTGQPQAAINAL